MYVQYGDRILMNNINVTIGEKDKVGLVGRNGAGKSTLLKLIAGSERADSGQIVRPTGSTLGFLHQDMLTPKGKTVIEETLTAFEEVRMLEREMERLNEELTERTDYETDSYMDLISKVGDISDRFHFLGGESMEADAEKILSGLGFKPTDMTRLTEEFSGGWQMRIELAKMLLRKPDYLLLDEPTNHLDIESIIWLEGFLKYYEGAVILISHDKQFLDNVTSRTIEIELSKVYDYKASYSKYVELKKDRRELMQSAYDNQQQQIAQTERLIDKFRAKASKAKFAQSLIKQLDKVDRIEMDDEDTSGMRLQFPPSPRSGEVVLEGKKVVKNYGELLVLKGVDLKLDRGDRVAFVGQNGQGKTTLAKILMGYETATGGDVTLGHNVNVGYYAQNQAEALYPKMTLLETMEQASPPEMRTKLRNILGSFMFSGEDVDKKVSVLSGGERARLAMACLLLKPINLLVLDEPTNHLDIISKDILKKALLEYDGTLLVVSHDRDFLSNLTNRTVEFRDHELFDHIGDVNEYLEKREMRDMRQVEMSSKKASSNGNSASSRVEDKDKKKLQKEVQNAERKISEVENELKKLERKMGEDGFYGSKDANKISAQYQQLKSELDNVMAEWEAAQMELEFQ